MEFTTAFNSGVHHIRATLVISSFDCLCSFDRCSRCAYLACLKTFTILIFYIYRFFQCYIICLCLPLYLNLFYLPLVRKTRDPEYRLSDLRLREEQIKISFSRNSTTWDANATATREDWDSPFIFSLWPYVTVFPLFCYIKGYRNFGQFSLCEQPRQPSRWTKKR